MMVSFKVRVRTVDLACIGWNYPAALGPDVSFAKKPIITKEGRTNYEPYIPGSSLKGALRSSASRVSTAYGFRSCGEVRPELIERAHEDGGPCDVCRLFGEPKSATPTPLFISDLTPDGKVNTFPVARIRLDDLTLRVAEGALFRVEYCQPGMEFSGTVTLDVGGGDEEHVGLLLLSFAELRLGRIGRDTLIDMKLEEVDGLRKITVVGKRWATLLDELSGWIWA